MLFIPQKAVKGQALAEFLLLIRFRKAQNFMKTFFESNITSEDEVWQMFFHGASRIGPKGKIIASVGVVFISPTKSRPS